MVKVLLTWRRLVMGAQQAGTPAAGAALQERLANLMCSRVLGCLAAVMSRAKLLAPREQACPHHCPEQVELAVLDAAREESRCIWAHVASYMHVQGCSKM